MNKTNILLKIRVVTLILGGIFLKSCNSPTLTVSLSLIEPGSKIVGEDVGVQATIATFEEEDPFLREWIFTKPNGSLASLSGEIIDDQRSFSADVPGLYVIQLNAIAFYRNGSNTNSIQNYDIIEIEVVPPSEDYSLLRVLRLPADTIVREPVFNLPYVAFSAVEENFNVELELNGVNFSTNQHSSNSETVIDSFVMECLDPGIYNASLNLSSNSGQIIRELSFQFEVAPELCSLPPSTDCQSGFCGTGIADAYIPQEGCANLVELVPADNVLINPGFEEGDVTIGPIPSQADVWQGDKARVIRYDSPLATYHNIHVLEGNSMMAFLGSATGEASTTTVSSQMFQSYGLNINQVNIADDPDRELMAIFKAYVNRVEGDNETDTRFYVTLGAYDGTTDTYRDKYRNNEELNGAEAVASIFSDGCVDTWELLTDTLIVPPGTRYLGLQIAAFEDVFNETGFETEFDGHFIDAVSLRFE